MGKAEALNVILWCAGVGDMVDESGQVEGWSEQWTVDGLEDSPRGRLARVELPSGRTRTVPLRELPEGVREGDLLEVRRGVGGYVFRALPAETRAARAQAQSRLERLNANAAERERADSALVEEGGEITL